jgi:hypothetical protein
MGTSDIFIRCRRLVDCGVHRYAPSTVRRDVRADLIQCAWSRDRDTMEDSPIGLQPITVTSH